jgi:hypothetical protein
VDGSEAGCEDTDVSDVAVGEVGKGDAVQRLQSRATSLVPERRFSLKICRILLASDAIGWLYPSFPLREGDMSNLRDIHVLKDAL